MREKLRRRDNESANKVQEIRTINQAFGDWAAKKFGDRYFLSPELVQVALSSRFERRQLLRRLIDRPECTKSVATGE